MCHFRLCNTISSLRVLRRFFLLRYIIYCIHEIKLPILYLFAPSPCVVANLWDVTDRDIDRFLEYLLKAWLATANKATPPNGSHQSLASLLNEAPSGMQTEAPHWLCTCHLWITRHHERWMKVQMSVNLRKPHPLLPSANQRAANLCSSVQNFNLVLCIVHLQWRNL